MLKPWTEEQGYSGYMVADVHQRLIASCAVELLNKKNLPGYSDFLPEVLAGNATVSHPFPSVIVLTDAEGQSSAGQPTMYAAAPVRDADGNVIAAFGFQLNPQTDFTRILSVAMMGESGETYAFNRDGLLLSESRFDDDLKTIGLIPDRPGSRSILKVDIRDPGGNMLDGFRPARERPQLALTIPVASGVTGGTSVNVRGYRNYRGVQSVAAWTWLPQYDIGIVTEIEMSEAYAPLYIVRRFLWGIYMLLAVGAVLLGAGFLVRSFLKRNRLRATTAA